jgi:hypothetical protein
MKQIFMVKVRDEREAGGKNALKLHIGIDNASWRNEDKRWRDQTVYLSGGGRSESKHMC